MTIYKARTNANFTTLFNHTIQDVNLTFEASGLLHLMLSLPEDWEIRKSWLQEQKLRCGRDKLTRMLGELIEQGYVVKRTVHGEDGRIAGVDWLVYPTPQIPINRTTEKPSDGKPATTKETQIQKKHNEIDIPTLSKKRGYPESFESLWKLKPEREGSNPKRAAFRSYNASLKRGHTHDVMLAGLLRYREHCVTTGKINTSYTMSMYRFLGPNDEFLNSWSVNHATDRQSKDTLSQYTENYVKYFSNK